MAHADASPPTAIFRSLHVVPVLCAGVSAILVSLGLSHPFARPHVPVVAATAIDRHLLLYLVLPRFKSLSQGQVLALFVFSLLVLAGYLYDSGGAINPLIHILIAPIAIGLVIFSRQPAFILILLTTAIYFLLNRFYVPIMSMKIPSLNAFFDWHLSGSAAVFLGISVLVMMIVFPLRQNWTPSNRIC